MKIKSVRVNNRKKCFEIEVSKRSLALPFCKLRLKPSTSDTVALVIVDPELAHQAITYRLISGKEDSVPLDAFLDYNLDPDYLRMLALHKLTLEAREAMKNSGIGKLEATRRLGTSPSQLYRLLDPGNQRKSVDEMLRLLSVLGCNIRWTVTKRVA